MKYSIRKKMFLISMATTIISFLLILVCFNFICNGYIEKESVSALRSAATMAQSAGMVRSISLVEAPWSITANITLSAAPVTDAALADIAYSATLKPIEAADQLQKEFTNSGNLVKLMVADKDETLYPSTLTEISTSSAVSVESIYNFEEVQALQSYASANTITAPTKVLLNDTNYYVLAAPIDNEATAIFYKNVQPLEDLVADVNTALLFLLFLCGIITVAASMGLSNGMVHSIRQLCNFAGEIGKGNFNQNSLQLKEKELSVLAEDMHHMAKQLSEYDAEQKTFFQNVSHELRTPLMSIQGYAEGITEGVFENEKVDDAAEVILAESERLASMVDDLLYLSRMDSSAQTEKAVEFSCLATVQAAIEQAQATATGKNIRLDVIQSSDLSAPSPVSNETDFLLWGNRGELEKAILNIITNGLRYAAQQVAVVCDCQARTIWIIDDGPGITEKDLPHIFKRFYKGDGGCTGIGLSISQTVIEKLGGTISAENIEGEAGQTGAMFTLLFPQRTNSIL